MGSPEAAPLTPLALSLSINSDLAWAARAMAAIRQLLVEVVGEERGEPFGLACVEAVNNAIVHGHGSDPALQVRILLEVTADTLTVAVRDHGTGLDPAVLQQASGPNPYEGAELEGLPESGLGFWLIRQGTDRLDYRKDPDGNWLSLVLERRG